MRSAARAFGREALRMATALSGAILLALLAAAPVTAQEIVRSEVHDLAVPERSRPTASSASGATPPVTFAWLARSPSGSASRPVTGPS